MIKLIFSLCSLLLSSSLLFSQLISIRPVFPSVDDTITLIYDASLGNSALTGVSPVYMHTGVITDKSNSPTDWKYVQGNWGTADNKVKMTDIGNNLHRKRYHIRSFYGIPSTDSLISLAFVFRNADGSLVGRATDGSDIYYPVYPKSGLFAKILSPESGGIYQSGETLTIISAANKNVSLSLYENGQLIAQQQGDSLGVVMQAALAGTHLIELQANDGSRIVRDTLYYTVNPEPVYQDPPAGTRNGINYINDSTVILQLTAPHKSFVYVIGDFNDWLFDADYFMNISSDSNSFWLRIEGLTPGKEYRFQYAVDGNIRIGDPYADKVLDPNNDQYISETTYPGLIDYPTGKTTHYVSVLQTAQIPYQWQNTSFVKPKHEDLVIYELLIRDFIHRHDYATLIDTLSYLERLGINCIHLMPIMEFEGNLSWGYNSVFYFAPDKYYGPKDDLKRFIDECHKRGIAVILDVVLNHAFGQCPLVRMWWDGAKNRPAADNPYFNEVPRHDFNVGFDFNHESPYTRAFAKDVLAYWVNEYKVDGYRFDLSKGFTQRNTLGDVGAWGQYDQSRIDILRDYANHIWNQDNQSLIILEHFADNSEEKVLAADGMLLWGNMNHNYNEMTMGYLNQSSLFWASYKNRGWSKPGLISYMESHDEERLMYKNLTYGKQVSGYDVRDLTTALKRMEMAGAVFFTIPGPKLMWQFGELGYEVNIDFNGRTGNKPIRWYYLDEPRRERLFKVWSAMIKLRINEPAFESSDFDLSTGGAIKRIRIRHASMNVVAIANADVVSREGTPDFPHSGWWYDYFSGDSMNVSDPSADILFEPGEYHIYTDKRLPVPDTDVAVGLETSPGEAKSWRVFPNPATDMILVRGRTEAAADLQMQVFDLSGKEVFRQAQKINGGDYELRWDTRNFSGIPVPGGCYILRITENGKSRSAKLLIQR